MSNWTAAGIQEMLASPQPLQLFGCVSLLLQRQARNGRYIQIKSHPHPAKNPVLNSSGVLCKALLLKTNSLSLFTAQVPASPLVTCLRQPQRRLLEKEEYYASVLERQAQTHIATLNLEQMCHIFYLKRATDSYTGYTAK